MGGIIRREKQGGMYYGAYTCNFAWGELPVKRAVGECRILVPEQVNHWNIKACCWLLNGPTFLLSCVVGFYRKSPQYRISRPMGLDLLICTQDESFCSALEYGLCRHRGVGVGDLAFGHWSASVPGNEAQD